jgi:DNA-binding CsgD family transcriptional regulator/N-acetylneuraminic acid mutarotase
VAENLPPLELSKREQQVLELVVTGASNKEIAHKLVISVNTVKVHMRNIFEKMGAQSRTEATRMAIQQKLVTIPAHQAELSEKSAPPLARTFLLSPNPPLTLPRWQQVYLLAALALAGLMALMPLLPAQTQKIAPDLPVIYAKPSPQAPTAASNGDTRWAAHPTMPTSRAGLALVAIDGQLAAIGGVRGTNKATRSVELFNPTANSWTEGDAKPTAAMNISGAAIDRKIYVPGGCADEGNALTGLEIYDPAADSWSTGAALPAPRCGYGLAVDEETLYLFGGWNGKSFEDTIFTYTPATDRWKTLPQTLPRPLGFMGAAMLNQLIYLAGGYNGETEFAEVYTFDPKTGAFEEKAPMQAKRGGLGLVSGGNNLYAIGGGWTQALDSSEKYNPAADSWSTFEAPFSDQWRNMGLASLDTSIYAVGGWDETKEEFMNSATSYQFIYQLFIPVSSFN